MSSGWRGSLTFNDVSGFLKLTCPLSPNLQPRRGKGEQGADAGESEARGRKERQKNVFDTPVSKRPSRSSKIYLPSETGPKDSETCPQQMSSASKIKFHF